MLGMKARVGLVLAALGLLATADGAGAPFGPGVVVAPSDITLSVHPTIVSSNDRMTIRGSVSNGRPDQKVTVQFKACGAHPLIYRDALETTTEAGGDYSFGQQGPFHLGVSGVYRAVSGDSVSAEVPVYQRVSVVLRAAGRGRYRAYVTAVLPFWRRHVLLQSSRGGGWKTLRRLLLVEQLGGSSGPAPPFQSIVRISVRTAPFRPGVRQGTRIRAVFPVKLAQPCYLGGVSDERRA